MKRLSIVQIQVVPMGRDIAFSVTGGDAHIGAVATAYADSGDSGVRGVRVELQELPGHREGELAAELAGKAARRLGTTVTVLAGIHVNRPTRDEITAVVAEARLKMEDAINEAALILRKQRLHP